MSKHRGHSAPPTPKDQVDHIPQKSPSSAKAASKSTAAKSNWSADAVNLAGKTSEASIAKQNNAPVSQNAAHASIQSINQSPTQSKKENTMAQNNQSSNNQSSSNQSSNNQSSNNQGSNSNNNFQNAQNAAQNAFQNAQNAFQSAFQNAGSNPFAVNMEEMTQALRANADAALQSFNTLTSGMNQINQQMMSLSQSLAQMGVAAMQSATSARTLREITDLQNDFAKTSFDTMVSRATEIQEQALKVANDASQPISARINETVERFNKAA